MRKIHIKTMVLGMLQTNCYIVSAPNSKEVVVIDPADNVNKIDQYLNENDLVCKMILLTHGHFDHITAANDLKLLTKAPICAHEDEADFLKDSNLNLSAHMGEEVMVEADILLKDGKEFQAGGLHWKVIYTPGHTKGGACYFLKEEKIIFSGDTLLYESIGRSDFPTGNHQRLIESIQSKLMTLSDDIEIYPGHGRPTTIDHEKSFNSYL